MRQAYFGVETGHAIEGERLNKLRDLFEKDEVLRKGLFTDLMYANETSREAAEALAADAVDNSTVAGFKNVTYIRDAAWYFKTLAAQEPGENNVLWASYRHQTKDPEKFTIFLPFFGTDYGLCSLFKPQISFNRSVRGTKNGHRFPVT